MTELAISLEADSKKPLYEQIYEYIKKEIQNGGLPFAQRLPSTRKLAAYLQVSRSTVDMAYEQLLSEGYIEAEPYRGYFVSELDGIYRELLPRKEEQQRKQTKKREHYLYDFSPNGVDLDSFPHNAWRKLSKMVLLDDTKELFSLGDPSGEAHLKHTITAHLHQSRGVSCRPEQVIIGAGTDYLLMLLQVVLGRKERIAMENPTYKKAYEVLKNLGNEMCVIDMDSQGMDVEKLEASGARIAYVMPSHQYPLGTVMPMKRRMQLLNWADKKEERFIIEDDYDSEFRYRGKPIPALQGFDRSGNVIYLGTFSKSIAPAIRVSYLVLPERLLPFYEARGRAFSSTVPRVDQMIVAAFLEEGYYERHLNKMRAVYKSRHDVLLEMLREFSNVGISGENAGVHLLLRFTDGKTEAEAVEQAKKQGVHVYGLSEYYVKEKEETHTVLLGYANLQEEAIREAVRRLQMAWI
jgi:GntR family transcriptional regulator/MocR family aminotransferase